MVANAAVGPAICTLLPPSAEITNPATMAVKIPASGPTPEASASAMDSGSAMIASDDSGGHIFYKLGTVVRFQ